MYEPPRQPSGCLEVWVLTRAIFGMLFWPLAALVGSVAGVVLIFYAFTVHPLLALAPIGGVALAVLAFARWEQRRFRPPGI